MANIRAPLIDKRIRDYTALIKPEDLWRAVPMTDEAYKTVLRGRQDIENVLAGTDTRKIAFIGPCSEFNLEESLYYAGLLNELRIEVQDRIIIIKRTFGEKSRTQKKGELSTDWEGYIHQPDPYKSADGVNEGLVTFSLLLARQADMGLPSGAEYIHPFVIRRLARLYSLSVIGARTVESSVHRAIASGLSMPVAAKNSTSGNVQVAVDAVVTIGQEHSFDGEHPSGRTSIVRSAGNPTAFVVLRGGTTGPNYDEDSVRAAQELLEKAGLIPNIFVAADHANAGKNHERYPEIFLDIFGQIARGNNHIIGATFESNLVAGRQDFPDDPKELIPGISHTDANAGWDVTRETIREAYKMLARA